MNETLKLIPRHALAIERMPRDPLRARLVDLETEKRPPLRHAASVEGPFATPAIVESSGVNV